MKEEKILREQLIKAISSNADRTCKDLLDAIGDKDNADDCIKSIVLQGIIWTTIEEGSRILKTLYLHGYKRVGGGEVSLLTAIHDDNICGFKARCECKNPYKSFDGLRLFVKGGHKNNNDFLGSAKELKNPYKFNDFVWKSNSELDNLIEKQAPPFNIKKINPKISIEAHTLEEEEIIRKTLFLAGEEEINIYPKMATSGYCGENLNDEGKASTLLGSQDLWSSERQCRNAKLVRFWFTGAHCDRDFYKDQETTMRYEEQYISMADWNYGELDFHDFKWLSLYELNRKLHIDNKKYEIIKCTKIKSRDQELYRIRALKDFSIRYINADSDIISREIKKGEWGGYINNYTCLSQNGDCWVFDDAKINKSCSISGNTILKGEVELLDNTHLSGASYLSGGNYAIRRVNKSSFSMRINQNICGEGELESVCRAEARFISEAPYREMQKNYMRSIEKAVDRRNENDARHRGINFLRGHC